MAIACPSSTSGTKSAGRCSVALDVTRLGDPLRFASGDANFYRWVFNNPVNLLDPLGLEAIGHHWVPVSVVTHATILHSLKTGSS
jgi:uncharacterized protein RhaS with RHS repeats